MRRIVQLMFLSALGVGPAAAQEPEEPAREEPTPAQTEPAFDEVELRIQAAQPGGRVTVDHGSGDGLEPGGRVLFRPRQGGTFEGIIMEVDDRTAVVELLDTNLTLAAGTRGAALIPRPEVPTDPVQLPWQNGDAAFTPTMPLLARIEAVRPENRPLKISGRAYAIFDGTKTSLDDRSDTFTRFGNDLLVENLFRRGGELHVDFELNRRTTDVPDEPDENESHLRIDRFSYAWGGTRFESTRWEVGRFLQHGLPEFGIVDGVEYGQRLGNGHGWGVSAGWMPEPDEDQKSGNDFQVAAFYHWVVDEHERLTLDGGFQKTFHNGKSDRELFVGKVFYLPDNGWTLQGTAWIDHYGSNDDAKDASLELTQMHASATRQYEGGSGMNFTYTRILFPELDRNEFVPILEEELADNHSDRISMSGWRALSGRRRLHGQIGAWVDEDDNGGDGQLGIELRNLLFEGSSTDFTLFGTDGLYDTTYGGRVLYGLAADNGRYDFLYEVSQNDHDDFPSDPGEIMQHRFRASRDLSFSSGWHLSVFAEALFWDEDEDSWSLGVYVQKSY